MVYIISYSPPRKPRRSAVWRRGFQPRPLPRRWSFQLRHADAARRRISLTRHILPDSETPNSESNRIAAVEKREAHGEVVTKPLCQPSELKEQRGLSPIFARNRGSVAPRRTAPPDSSATPLSLLCSVAERRSPLQYVTWRSVTWRRGFQPRHNAPQLTDKLVASSRLHAAYQ